MARGKHLFPFRTEQLSPSAPMVLGPQGPGRVGRRRLYVVGRAALGRPVLRCRDTLGRPVLALAGCALGARGSPHRSCGGSNRLAPVQTARLQLRPIAEEDVDALADLDALTETRAAR